LQWSLLCSRVVVLSGHKNSRSKNVEARPVTLSEWGHGTTEQTNKHSQEKVGSMHFVQLQIPELRLYSGQAGCRHCTYAGMFWPRKGWANAAAPFCNTLMSVAATAWLWADSERLRRPMQNQSEVFNTRRSRQARSSSPDGRKLLVTHGNSFFVCLSTENFKG
jgi:hypothetical protein